MQKARVELGEDARLVSARRVSAPGAPAVYEVRVTGTAAVAVAQDQPSFGELRNEIRELKQTVSSIAGGSSTRTQLDLPASPESAELDAPVDPAMVRWAELLRRRGTSERAARAIIRKAESHLANRVHEDARTAVRAALAETFGPVRRRDLLGDRPTLFVGPTGAGKTTTLAKIAADLVAAGERPVLVCADGESLTGEENLQAVATALGLPFESAFMDGQLETLVERLGEDRIYLVDTAGVPTADQGAMDRLDALARSLPDPEVLLVMPATSDTEEARLTLDAFAPLGVERVILTKLDEMIRPGRVVDLAVSLSRPIVRVTYGRSVRGSTAHPGTEPIIARILGSDLRVETSA